MATVPVAATHREPASRLARYMPALDWLRRYRREDLPSDGLAGLIVAIMLVPQGMAYALLAGLPPQVGLYASIVPLLFYGLFGTSRTLSVAPVAIMSLITASGLSALALPGSPDYVSLALTLALLLGVIQVLMGLFRLGFVVNFLSHPVLSGFINAAALVIGASQLKHLLGIQIPNADALHEVVRHIIMHASETNLVTLSIGLGGIAILFLFRDQLGRLLKRLKVSSALADVISKSGPLVVVLLGTLLVWGFSLTQKTGVKIVGDIPMGLPPLGLPALDTSRIQALLPTALTLALVGFMESISVAKSLASKRRQKIDADQELRALGLANLGAAFTGGYPVTGGLSRSVVNFTAGARTGLSSIITALLVALTVLFFTPLFYYLPQAVLAAIVLVAITALFDLHTLRHTWRYNKADAASWIITFIAVLEAGVETGIVVGVISAIALFLWRTSRPHVAELGRVGTSQIYRNIRRHEVTTCPHLLVMRIDESLYFANAKFLEDTVLRAVSERPQIEHFVLVGTAINFIDASALETLESLAQELHDIHVEFHLAAIKGPVLDRLKATDFVNTLGADHIHESTHEAMQALKCVDGGRKRSNYRRQHFRRRPVRQVELKSSPDTPDLK